MKITWNHIQILANGYHFPNSYLTVGLESDYISSDRISLQRFPDSLVTFCATQILH